MKKLILIISIFLPSISEAQLPLSLKECKRMARENNIALRSARNKVEQAELACKEAFTNYYPKVSAMFAGMAADKHLISMDIDLPDALTAMMPAGVDLPSKMGVIKNGVAGTVMAMQPIYAGGQITNANRLAEVGLHVSNLQLEMSQDEVDLNTEQLYWQIVSLKEKLQTISVVRSMLERLEKDVKASVDAGLTTRNDLLQVQLKLNELDSQTLKVKNGIEISKKLLAQYVGMEGQQIDVEPCMVIEKLKSGEIANETADILKIKQEHSSVFSTTSQYRLAEKGVEAEKLNYKMKLGERMPTVSAGVVYSYNNLTGSGRGVGMLMATVSVPISDWWTSKHSLKRQELVIENANQQMLDVGQKLVINMDNCWSNVETSYKQLEVNRLSIEQSEVNLNEKNQFYKAGMITMSDLLEAQTIYQKSCDSYVDAFIDYQLSFLKYRQAVGF